MRVYIVVKAEAWESAKESGVLRGKDFARLTDYEQKSMSWLQTEMGKRLTSYSGGVPVFGWAQRPPSEDLNQHAKVGDHVVILEAEITPDRILPMHFLGWAMYVMNSLYLSKDRAEDLYYDRNPATQEQLEASWCRIFEPWTLHPYFTDATVQYAIDTVMVSEVVRVVHEVVPEPPELPDPSLYYVEPVEDTAIPFNDPRVSEELRTILSRPNLYN